MPRKRNICIGFAVGGDERGHCADDPAAQAGGGAHHLRQGKHLLPRALWPRQDVPPCCTKGTAFLRLSQFFFMERRGRGKPVESRRIMQR